MPPAPRQPLMLDRVGRLPLQLEMDRRLQHSGAVRPWVQQECGAVPMRRDDAAAVFSNTSRLRVFFCISAAQDSAAVRRRDPAPSTREDSRLRPLLVMAAGFVLASHCAAACPVGVFCVFLRNEPPFLYSSGARSVCGGV